MSTGGKAEEMSKEEKRQSKELFLPTYPRSSEHPPIGKLGPHPSILFTRVASGFHNGISELFSIVNMRTMAKLEMESTATG